MDCPNWHIDSATLLRKCPPNQRKILFLGVMVAQLSLEAAPPGLRTGQDHHAARILVEPMHDSRQLDTLSIIERDSTCQDHFGQRPGRLPRCSENGQPGRFVYGNDVIINIQNRYHDRPQPQLMHESPTGWERQVRDRIGLHRRSRDSRLR